MCVCAPAQYPTAWQQCAQVAGYTAESRTLPNTLPDLLPNHATAGMYVFL